MADWSLDHIARVRNKAATGDGLGPFWRELVVEALDQLAAAKSSPPTAMPIRATKATENALRALAIYDRVHAELDDGKTWDEIDNGLVGQRSYEGWRAYFTQCLINSLRSIVSAAPHPSALSIADAGDGWQSIETAEKTGEARLLATRIAT